MKRLNALKRKISLLILIILAIQIVGTAGAFISNDVYAENDLQIVDTEYNALLSELQSILNEKNFENEVNEIIIDGMKSLWDSYDNIYFSYSTIGYPNKEQYIRDNYIRGINEVSNVRLMSDEEIEFQPGVAAYVSNDEDGNPYMCLKFKPSDENEYKEYLNTLQHEVKHIIQNENWNEKPEEYLYMLRASAEGWAVLGEMNKYRNNDAEDIKFYFNESKIDENDNYIKIGGIGSTTEYSLLPNVILKLTIIVGYDNIYKFETGEITYEDLLSIIQKKLGNETAERFIEDLKTAMLNYSRDYNTMPGMEAFWFNNDVDYDKIFDAENIVLNELKNRITSADSKEEVQSLFNFYYIYKKYYCAKYKEIKETVIEESEYGKVIERKVTDKSNEKLNLESLENTLLDKVIQYNAINEISKNEKLNRNAIKSLLSEDDKNTYTGSICLKYENYIYTETEEDGMLIGNITIDGVEAKFDCDEILSSKFNYLGYGNGIVSENKLMKNNSVDIDENADDNSNIVNTIGETWTSTSNIGVRIKNSKLEVENLERKENYYYYFWIVDDDKDLLPEGKEFYLTAAQINSISLVNIGDDISYWLEENDIKNLKIQLVEEDTKHDTISRVIINNVGLEEILNGKKKEIDNNNDKDKGEDKEIEDKSNEDKDGTFTYKIIEGANQTYKGNGNLIIKSNGDIKKFVKLEIDNKDVSTEYYTMKSGSTIIELKEAFVAKLNEGKHEITFIYSDGKVSTTFEVKKQTNDGTQAKTSLPQTGDKIGLILVIAIISAGIFVITTKHRSKKI